MALAAKGTAQWPRKRRSACDATHRRNAQTHAQGTQQEECRCTPQQDYPAFPVLLNLHTSVLCRSQANRVVCPHISMYASYTPLSNTQTTRKETNDTVSKLLHYRMIGAISPHEYFYIYTTEVCLPSLSSIQVHSLLL